MMRGEISVSSLRFKQIALLLALVIGSGAYTYSYHTLDTHFLGKSLGILLPMQVGASLYLLYLYWSGKLTGRSPKL